MLGHGQQLDMGEAETLGVGNELGRQFVVGQIGPVDLALPGAEMDLVDRYRRAAMIAGLAASQISGVGP